MYAIREVGGRGSGYVVSVQDVVEIATLSVNFKKKHICGKMIIK
jgi:hypothetical protein